MTTICATGKKSGKIICIRSDRRQYYFIAPKYKMEPIMNRNQFIARRASECTLAETGWVVWDTINLETVSGVDQSYRARRKLAIELNIEYAEGIAR